jgi:two-component system chemotaxis response regulator CheB
VEHRLIVLGASAGGPQAVLDLVAALPPTLDAPVLVVVHIGARPTALPRLLTDAGPLPAAHARDGDPLRPGRIIVAPPDHHLLVEPGVVRVSRGPQENMTRPALDPLFRSAALAYGPRVVAAILTGMRDDGTAGLLTVADAGGTTIVQEPADAAAPSMPLSALNHMEVDHRCPLKQLGPLLAQLAAGPVGPERGGHTECVLLEARIAAGTATEEDMRRLDALTAATQLHCPLCGKSLRKLPDRRMLRYRCANGHAV